MESNTSLWILGHKLKPHPTTGNFDLAIFETPAGAQGPPPHTHSIYEEAFLILEGEMEFMLNGTIKTFGAGESIDVPPGTLHTFNNKSDKPCKWINIHSPKGFYSFFERFGIPADEEKAPLKSLDPSIIEQVLQTAGEYDMTISVPSKA